MGLLTLTPTDKKGINKAKKLGMVGNDGLKDTELVQMNKPELGLLAQTLGRTPSVNPHTGLLSFAEGGGPGSGSSGRSGGGQRGDGGGGPGGGGGMGHDPGHGGANPGAQGGGRSTGPTGPAGGGGNTSPGGYGPRSPTTVGNENAARGVTQSGGTIAGFGGANGTTRSSKEAEGGFRTSLGLGPLDKTPTVSLDPYSERQKQLQQAGFLERALNFFSPLGFNTLAPIGNPASYAQGQRQVSVNPGSLAGSIAGLATGMTGLGTLAGKVYDQTGLNNVTVTGPGGLFSGNPSNAGQSFGGMFSGTTGLGGAFGGGTSGTAGSGGSNGGNNTGQGGNHDGTAADPYRVYTGNVSQTTPQQYAANTGLLQLTQPGQMIGGVWQPPYSYYAWG